MADSTEQPRWIGGMPGDLINQDLSTLLPRDDNPAIADIHDAAYKLINEWHGEQFVGMYLYGDPGTGKSHAAIGIAEALHAVGA